MLNHHRFFYNYIWKYNIVENGKCRHICMCLFNRISHEKSELAWLNLGKMASLYYLVSILLVNQFDWYQNLCNDTIQNMNKMSNQGKSWFLYGRLRKIIFFFVCVNVLINPFNFRNYPFPFSNANNSMPP